MGGHVVIVDSSPARRAGLIASLAGTAGPVVECGDPASLPDLAAHDRPALVLLDLGAEPGPALAAAARLRALPGPPPPILAMTLPGLAAPRLAALRAGLDGLTTRGAPSRVLQARARALLRSGPLAALGTPEPTDLADAPPAAPAAAPPRVLLLTSRPEDDTLATHLGHPVARAPLSPDLPGPAPDLLILDALATQGDLAQGARVLALLADLLGREGTRDAATLLLLPVAAPETTALALDLGAGDVLTDPCGPEEVALRARLLLDRRARALRLRDRLRSHLRAAVTDPLTGLHNLHHANPALARLSAQAARDGVGFAVLMVDIDRFKQVNDTLGHAAGDRVLAAVARRLRGRLRRGDHLARVGGEEFRAVLPGASLDDARAVAESLRRAVRARPVALPRSLALAGPEAPEEPPSLAITVSIGVAAATAADLAAGLDPAALVARADAALYAAKAGGRDRVTTEPPRPPATPSPPEFRRLPRDPDTPHSR